MITVGFIGSRGLVGSVLLQRMQAEHDFTGFEPLFFSTSQIGKQVAGLQLEVPAYQDAYDIETLKKLTIIVSCQGGAYTEKIYPQLRQAGWQGYWIDAASTLRLAEDSIIVLDPINHDAINIGLANGIKNYIGGNCTVSLLLMALHGLVKQDLIEWLSVMTYQAVSGAGAQAMRDLITDMHKVGAIASPDLDLLALDKKISATINSSSLAANLIPWIDIDLGNGQSREEHKLQTEANKILAGSKHIAMDGICVRVGALRCHSQAITIKLKKSVSITDIEAIIGNANQWVKVIPNQQATTINSLTPLAVSGTLNIPIGRIRALNLGPKYLTAFTVGDQLLWGAAEPLRRVLKTILNK